MESKHPTLLTDRHVAEQLGISPLTLARWRYEGRGPVFLKIGKAIRYRQADVDAWLANQVFPSTAAVAESRKHRLGGKH